MRSDSDNQSGSECKWITSWRITSTRNLKIQKKKSLCEIIWTLDYLDTIWTTDLAEMESLSSKNKNVEYMFCVIDVFSKYAWVKPSKDKNSKQVLNAFIKMLNESDRKPNKL